MKLPSLALALVLAAACDADDEATLLTVAASEPASAPAPAATGRPTCVEAFIRVAYASDRSAPWYVRRQRVRTVPHYWLDTGAPAYDGTDVIVLPTCDTACTIGGFRVPPACLDVYDPDAWEVVWEG